MNAGGTPEGDNHGQANEHTCSWGIGSRFGLLRGLVVRPIAVSSVGAVENGVAGPLELESFHHVFHAACSILCHVVFRGPMAWSRSMQGELV